MVIQQTGTTLGHGSSTTTCRLGTAEAAASAGATSEPKAMTPTAMSALTDAAIFSYFDREGEDGEEPLPVLDGVER
ncbi:MAG: hypothetical protein ACLQDY_19270 [Streptosporangiaceae bacterium]